MNRLDHIEQNIADSFHFVRNDIVRLENENHALKARLHQLEEAHKRLLLAVSHQPFQNQGFRLIGDKQTKELHSEDCIIARSSKPANKLLFHSKLEAKNRGFNECICLY